MGEEEKVKLELIKENNEYKYCVKNDVDFLLNLIEKQEKIIDKLIEKEAIEVMCYDTEDERKEYEKELKEKLFKEIENE